MRTSQAEIFLAVVEQGSVAGAARQLGRSRTTVSTALGAFEDELGVHLFERIGNQLRLTPIGSSIQADCRRLAQTGRQIQDRCSHHLDGVESALRIARDDALPEVFWRQTLAALKQRFPLTGISVYLAPPQELQALVSRQAVDIAFGLAPAGLNDPSLQVQELGDIRMLTVAAPEHPLCQLPRVSPDDLMLYTEVTTAFLQNNLLVPQMSDSPSYLALTQFELIRDTVIEGAGWANLPLPLVAAALKAEQLKVFKHPKAQTWQSYGTFTAPGALSGQIMTWLENQLVEYLTSFN
ncbi:LysR family transcriptional regulator [Marinobacter caseinilyticus]|uniref:LysR family transcriptional regulator n=1 Tax=Marinobacter caseinilyticus TaxID=2692195 RepID=UPI00140BDDAE|nr:LysR family transcriptional regulator [Marinobacter caseinilyticus]